MLVLLSPAKTLETAPRNAVQAASQPVFLEEAAQLVTSLRALSARQIARLMEVNDDLAALNAERFAAFSTPFHPGNASPALLCFQGEVYRGLDAATLTTPDLEFAQRHVRILSGLYGLLRPLDLMQPYRLEMGLKWGPDKKTPNLYAFWGDRLARAVDAEAEGVVLNLASTEYARAVLPHLQARVITIHFKDRVQDEYKPLMTYAKHARGEMARFVVRKRIDRPEGVQAFTGMGYGFRPELSAEFEWTFTRDAVPS
jgi:cytoplasmic iron level regulating protein YaaA (DUF328/UPF0246 family)